MKVWVIILVFIGTASQSFAASYKNDRKNDEDRRCLTPKGKFGFCVSANACPNHVSTVNVEDNMCTENKVNEIVCCPVNKIKYPREMPAESSVQKSKHELVLELLNDASDINSQIDASIAQEEPVIDEDILDLVDILSRIVAFFLIPGSLFYPNTSSDSYSNPQEMASSASLISGPVAEAAFLSDVSSFSSQEPLSTVSVSTANPQTASVSEGNTPKPETSESDSMNVISEASTTPSTPKFSAASTSQPTSLSTPKPTENDYASAFPEPPVCGVSQGIFSRVVGGRDANLGDFPWIGLIAYNVTGGFMFKCGASLITSQHSLTAAHCLYNMEDQLFFVRLGELDLSDHNKTRPVDAIIKNSVIHQNYSTTHGTNDIGILVFHRRVRFTDLISPICLPLSEELRTNSFVNYQPFVAGWGRTKYQGPSADRLQVLQLPVVSEESCLKAYAPLKVITIDQRVICAGGQGGVDACNGDSGGPLMQPIWDSTNYTTYFYQIGIVSLGMKCGTPGYPGVYTRVSVYIDWLREQVLGIAST